ncbi:MAG: exodeoxyribonuclease VII large subunit [Candidatus Omnitrophota bacterium]
MAKEYLTVSELNGLIKEVVNYGFPQALWICGEIQGLNRNREKKHVFFELCEKDPVSKDIVARIGLVIFSGRKEHIEEVLKNSENSFQLKDDIEVKFLCKVDFYPPHGAVRLVVENIDPIYTLGKIAQERQRLIARLKEKGLLDKNKQLSISSVPLNIGLITSYDSAAYNDFISELKRSGFAFKIFFVNSLMQGKGVPADVCRALSVLNQMKDLDVIVITRGGGSIAELSCFDNEAIASAIASSRLPVLSGIGHEINVTVTDLTAHTFAKTPTAIAQFLIERIQDFLFDLDEKLNKVLVLSQDRVGVSRKNLRFQAFNLQSQVNNFMKVHRQRIIHLESEIAHRPLDFLRDRDKDISAQRLNLIRDLKAFLRDGGKKIENYKKLIDFVKPQNTLRRGFSITRTSDGRLVRHTADIKIGEDMLTDVLDGHIHSRVDKLKKEDSGE